MSRWKQQLGGLSIALIGAGFTAWTWRTALNEGYYYVRSSMVFPAVCVVGLGLIFFPGYRDERIARGEDISEMNGWKLITARWWAILVVALVGGVGNYFLLSSLSK
jgi:ABC-type Fe3+-siderophore transport system permease subunit